MKLSKDIIYYRLLQSYKTRYLSDSETETEFSRPVFFTAKKLPSKCVVMIKPGDIKLLEEFPPSAENLLVCCGVPERPLEIPGCTIICVDEAAQPVDVFNSLQEIYNEFDKWDEELKKIYYKGGSFSDLVDCCDPIVCDPICLTDSMFRYIGFSKALSEQRGLTASVDSNNMLSVDLVNSLLANQKFNSINKIEGTSKTAPIGNVEGDLLFKNIFNRDEFVGRLMIKLASSNEYRVKYNKIILEHLYTYTILLYDKYSSFNKKEISLNGLRILLQDILDGNAVDAAQFNKALEENNWDAGNQLMLIQIKPSLRYDKQMYAAYFSTEIESNWQGCVCFEHQNKFLILVNIHKFTNPEKLELKQALAYFLRESLLVAGLSRVFFKSERLSSAFKQTEIALELGEKKSPTFWYYSFNDYALDYILSSGTASFEPEQICSEKLLTLREYDIKNNTEYCKTLLVYIRSKFNSTEAARRLIIQRSSLNYRLERIRELAHIDLNSDEEILYMMLSFKVLRIGSV